MKTKKLEFVPRGLSRADTTVVIRELREIEANDGLITPKAVVARARPKASPLHPFFEWTDKVAAEKYREVQARQLIACVYIRDSDSDSPESVRAFVNIKAQGDNEDSPSLQGYVSMQTAIQNPSMQAQVLAYAQQQLVAWRLRFGHLQQFFRITQEIDKVIPPKQQKKAA